MLKIETAISAGAPLKSRNVLRGPSAIFYIDEPDLVQEAVGSNTNSVMKPAAAYVMIVSVALAFPRVGLTEPHESDRQASNHLTVLVFYHFHHVLAVRSFFFSFFFFIFFFKVHFLRNTFAAVFCLQGKLRSFQT